MDFWDGAASGVVKRGREEHALQRGLLLSHAQSLLVAKSLKEVKIDAEAYGMLEGLATAVGLLTCWRNAARNLKLNCDFVWPSHQDSTAAGGRIAYASCGNADELSGGS